MNDDYFDVQAWLAYAPTEALIQILGETAASRRAFHRVLLAIRGLKVAEVESWR